MQETLVQSLGWEIHLKREKATHPSILGLENSMDCMGLENFMDWIVHRVAEGQTWLSDFQWK